MSLQLLTAAALFGFVPAPIEEIVLPEEPRAVVLSLTHLQPHQPKDREPNLVIRADGEFESDGGNFEAPRRVLGRVSQAEIRDLLRYIVIEQRLLRFDPVEVNKAIVAERKKRWKNEYPGEVTHTILRVQLGREVFTVTMDSLDFNVALYGRAIPELQQYMDVLHKLHETANRVYAGGPEGIAKALAAANEKLKAAHPTLKPLSAADFQHAHVDQADNRLIYFHRRGVSRGEYVQVEVQVPANGQMIVTVEASRPRPRF
jgi:hypothetical protein